MNGGALATAIFNDATRLVSRHQRYAAELHNEFRRRQRRTGVSLPKVVQTPTYWMTDSGFHPYHMRTVAERCSLAMDTKLRAGKYAPFPAVIYEVPKSDGSMRSVSVFQVADNALSRLVYASLTAKNTPRLSARCYAYRQDVSRHDALFYVHRELQSDIRVFVAEFDFSKFFDNIRHDHIERVLVDHRFIITRRELAVVRSFLSAPAIPQKTYSRTSTDVRTMGIPQGTSISLFLANIAAFPLDRQLEKLGIGFARFADDTLIWSNNYGELCRGVDALSEAAHQMGVRVNLQKSPGISILVEQGESGEFRSKTHVEFLGASISRKHIGLKRSVVTRIKDRISWIVFQNLVQPLRRGYFVAARVAAPVDRDYVVALFQIRRYLYGGLSEAKLRRYLSGVVPNVRFWGLLSSFPLVDDEAQLKSLDGWLVHTIRCALRLRKKLLASFGATILPVPHGISVSQLIQLKTPTSKNFVLDLRLPSFVRMAALLRRSTRTFGPNAIAHPGSGVYYP